MKGLVSPEEIANAIKVNKFGLLGTGISSLLMQVLSISEVNRIYESHKHLDGLKFINALLDTFEVQFEVNEEDLKRIPKTGPFITVSNHPLGGIDGIILLKLLLEKRPDFKLMANFLLQRIEPLEPYILPVNPFENHKEAYSSFLGFKAALSHLKGGNSLGIFPAGEVSTHRESKLIVDKFWEPAVMKLIKRAEIPIVPVYFHAKNSRLFYKLAQINGTLRTAKLPSELLNQKDRLIKIRIGKPITVANQKEHEELDKFTEFVRKKTYVLSNVYPEKKHRLHFSKALKLSSKPKEIIPPIDTDKMVEEIEMLRENDKRLLQSKDYEVFLSTADEIPNLLLEIARLREITFREVGEGTNNEMDLDEFDRYYHQMILWDNAAQKVTGAYRMGMGSTIYKTKGIHGFYLRKLFRFKPEMYQMMSESIEMGRAFIIKEYQQRPLPLFLLWKGIVHVTLRFPEHKYLIGVVSISDKFSDFTKSLMIEFMKSNYYDTEMAQYVRPKKEYKVTLKDTDKDFIFEETQSDLNKFDKLIDEIEPGNLRLPVLIKKYIKQNARVISFNVDPRFNNAVDGLMYIRISDLPEGTVKPVIEEFQLELEKKYEILRKQKENE